MLANMNFIKTGRTSDKFGVSIDQAMQLTERCIQNKNLKIVGLTCHIGSQITELEKFKEAATQSLKAIARCRKVRSEFRFY